MGNFEDRDRDKKTDKPMSGQEQGQESDRNKPGSHEPGRESSEPREGQGSGSPQRSGNKSRTDDEESA